MLDLPLIYRACGWSFSSLSSITFAPNSFVIDPPSQTCPVSFGLRVSEMSYCLYHKWNFIFDSLIFDEDVFIIKLVHITLNTYLTSPCTQLEKYKYLSSMDIRISVNTGGISGSAHPSTFLDGWSITWSLI